MTPEERADEVCRLFGIPRRPEQDRGSEWGPRLCARIAKAIRCAEDEALERAAATFDELPGFSSFPSDNESAMRVVRACAAQVRSLVSRSSDPAPSHPASDPLVGEDRPAPRHTKSAVSVSEVSVPGGRRTGGERP